MNGESTASLSAFGSGLKMLFYNEIDAFADVFFIHRGGSF